MFLTNNRSQYPKECKRSLFDISEVMYHNLRFFSPIFFSIPISSKQKGAVCAPVLLEQRNSLLWECTHESWSSAKTPRTRKLRQGCAVPRPAWLQNCLNSDRGRRPSASFVVRMLYCLRGDTCEPRAPRTNRAAFWDLTCDKNAKAYSLPYAETKRYLSSSLCAFHWEAVSQRRSAQAWVCRIKKLISGPFQGFFFFFGWYLNLQDRQGCLG